MTIKEIQKRYKNRLKAGYCEFCGEKLNYDKFNNVTNKTKCKKLFVEE